MKESEVQINRVDWIAVSIYFALVIIGWFNIYAVVYDSQVEKSIFDL
jgi:rod shape determining protein RodA